MPNSGGGLFSGLWLCIAVCVSACSTDRAKFEDGNSTGEGNDSAKMDSGSAAAPSTDSESTNSESTNSDATVMMVASAPTAAEASTTSSQAASSSSPAADCEPSQTRSCAEGGLLGNCGSGVQSCDEDGKFGPCSIAPAATDECTADDDANCNGTVNEGCPCIEAATRPCADGGHKGACADGLQACLADGTWSDCDIQPAAADDCAVSGDDADCDGTPNSGCACTDGDEQSCGPSEAVGNCVPGVSLCVDGSFQPCEGAIEATSRDCSSAEDNDCDGSPDNTIDAACACVPGTTQPCETHPGLDDNGPCRAGTQPCQASADGSSSSWGACTGSVGPELQDACDGPDDSNCNGTPNDGCDCTTDADCNDNVACTQDTCSDGACSHTVQSGSCLIAGACIANGAPDPTNACRSCDTAASSTGWSNASPGTSCDDSVWCNGTDTCNGGTCAHQFPSGNRCTGTGDCDLTSCDESRDSCFAPATEVCGTGEEFRCGTAGGCGGIIESRQTQTFCSGNASACTGSVKPSTSWTESSTCPAEQVCTATSTTESCGDSVDCVAFCDSNNLCWSHADAGTLDYNSAVTYCSTKTWAGKSWGLPTIQQWLGVLRGCQDGWEGNENHTSQCTLSGCSGSSCTDVTLCGACDWGEGPDTGSTPACYWIPAMVGTCANDSTGYWSKTSSSAGHWVSYPLTGDVSSFGVDNFSHHAKCVTTR